jgi:hypothetical protein
MANLTGYAQVFAGDTSVVDTILQQPLGTRGFDGAGGEYIYLQGVLNTAAGSWVTFDEAHLTTLATANAQGRVGVAMAAIGASKYGWYQIYGMNTIAKVLTSFADNGKVYLTSTAGSVDDTDVAGDAVIGAIGRSAIAALHAGCATMELNYPIVMDLAVD